MAACTAAGFTFHIPLHGHGVGPYLRLKDLWMTGSAFQYLFVSVVGEYCRPDTRLGPALGLPAKYDIAETRVGWAREYSQYHGYQYNN